MKRSIMILATLSAAWLMAAPLASAQNAPRYTAEQKAEREKAKEARKQAADAENARIAEKEARKAEQAAAKAERQSDKASRLPRAAKSRSTDPVGEPF